jgi:hypothetical protein
MMDVNSQPMTENSQVIDVNSQVTTENSQLTSGNSLSGNAEAEFSASAQRFGVKIYEG